MTYKKQACLLLMAIFAVGIFSGCQKDTSLYSGEGPVTVTVWNYYNGPQKVAFDNAVTLFNETIGIEQDIIVETVSFGSVAELSANLNSALRESLGSSELPDIFSAYRDIAFPFYQAGMLASLDELFTPEEIAEYAEDFIEDGRFADQQLYILPAAKSTESLFLNKTYFDQFMQDYNSAHNSNTIEYEDLATWEGIARVSLNYNQYTDMQTPEIEGDGKSFFGIDSMANFIIISNKQLGIDLIEVQEGNVEINLDKDVLRAIFDVYFPSMVHGGFAKHGLFCSDDIKTGDTLMMIGSTTSAQYFPDQIVLASGEVREVALEVLPMPVYENGEKYAITQGAGMAVLKSRPQKENAAAVFLKWFTDKEVNSSFSMLSGYIPVKKDALANDMVTELLQELADNDEKGVNTAKALSVGIGQLQNYQLYANMPFEGSLEFRDVLGLTLEEQAKNARQEVLDALSRGDSLTVALERINMDEAFHAWYSTLQHAVELYLPPRA